MYIYVSLYNHVQHLNSIKKMKSLHQMALNSRKFCITLKFLVTYLYINSDKTYSASKRIKGLHLFCENN